MTSQKRIYIALPIQGQRLGNNAYQHLSKAVDELGFLVANPQVLEPPLEDAGARFNPRDVYQDNYRLLKSSDLLVAEISRPSLGVGYEIASAEHFGLPILCVYQAKLRQSVSLMILGIPYRRFLTASYNTVDELKMCIESAVRELMVP